MSFFGTSDANAAPCQKKIKRKGITKLEPEGRERERLHMVRSV